MSGAHLLTLPQLVPPFPRPPLVTPDTQVFDFGMLKKFLSRKDFTFVFDAMHAVTGPYAKRILVQVEQLALCGTRGKGGGEGQCVGGGGTPSGSRWDDA